jgi:hypothetical protein
MIPVKLTQSPAHQIQTNHEPKLSLLEPPGDRRPTLLQGQTPAFSRSPVNRYTPYTYTTIVRIFPVNHCTPYTYTNRSTRCKLTNLTSYTYIENCAICVLAQPPGGGQPYQTPPLLGFASTFVYIAAGGPPAHPNPRFHPPKPPFDPYKGVAPPPNQPACNGQSSLLSSPPSCADHLTKSSGSEK